MLPLVPAVQAQEQGRQDQEVRNDGCPNIIFIMSDDHARAGDEHLRSSHRPGGTYSKHRPYRAGRRSVPEQLLLQLHFRPQPRRDTYGQAQPQERLHEELGAGISTAHSRRLPKTVAAEAATRLPSSVSGILFPSRRASTIG